MTGKIKRLIRRRGFGFIGLPDGEDLFFHCSGLEDVDFEDLKEGDLMGFEVEEAEKGKKATNVRRIEGKKTGEKTGEKEEYVDNKAF